MQPQRGAADYFMVLPKLSDPSSLAAWRGAADAALDDAALQSAARASAVTLLASPDAIAELAALNISLSDQAGLQDFLASRFGWHPG